ncbi:MAG: hypothetical protein NVS9B3_08340 [Gemmatimonadaceae bacterium]
MPPRLSAPWLIIVDGPSLDHRVMMDDWSDNQQLLAGLGPAVSISDRGLRQRPRLRLSLFWEPRFLGLPPHAALTTLAPDDADQTGYFYPAYGGAPAVVFIGKPRLFAMAGGQRTRLLHAGDSALEILRRYGVPLGAE